MRPLQILFYLGIIFSLFTCRRSDDAPREKTVFLTLKIKDDVGNNVTGAKIYVFGKLRDYEIASAKFNGINAVDSTISVNGDAKMIIYNNTNYWLYIVYKDNTRRLVFTNEGYSTVINQLPKNLDATVEIILSAANGNLAFWSTSQNSLPISIVFNGDTLLLNSSLASRPSNINSPGVVFQTIKAGTVRYYAKNRDGCIWTEEVRVGKGEYKPVELVKCEMGSVVFYSGAVNSEFLPITITLNDTDLIGSITETREIFTCGNSSEQTLTVKKEPGLFTYIARSANAQCVWTGSVRITKDQCTAVKLTTCK